MNSAPVLHTHIHVHRTFRRAAGLYCLDQTTSSETFNWFLYLFMHVESKQHARFPSFGLLIAGISKNSQWSLSVSSFIKIMVNPRSDQEQTIIEFFNPLNEAEFRISIVENSVWKSTIYRQTKWGKTDLSFYALSGLSTIADLLG